MIKGAGPGSTLEVGKKLTDFLARIIKKYDIKRINDAGCGSVSWLDPSVCAKWDVYIQGYDRDPEYQYSVELDITKDRMPPADLIICKDVFRHMDLDQVKAALELFDAKYLVCDTDPGAPNDFEAERPLDMEKLLGKPLSKIKSIEKGNAKYKWHRGKYFALWRLN